MWLCDQCNSPISILTVNRLIDRVKVQQQLHRQLSQQRQQERQRAFAAANAAAMSVALPPAPAAPVLTSSTSAPAGAPAAAATPVRKGWSSIVTQAEQVNSRVTGVSLSPKGPAPQRSPSLPVVETFADHFPTLKTSLSNSPSDAATSEFVVLTDDPDGIAVDDGSDTLPYAFLALDALDQRQREWQALTRGVSVSPDVSPPSSGRSKSLNAAAMAAVPDLEPGTVL